ncbi:MarR family transcriptional regulator [Staphylococcus argenteus]|nr:MarR family transcriptional regulator [Staphylococcus argenteus]MCG9799932.1 MarR family transcriptional regulator [Staphylococcus argenteus]MCG9801622.1 MarR family transcriptional regulator [Staphylococcus argenteus]MCG9804065.1 MarR family transcriptional regulator [Staphylococcus argenteus]MCG9809160.1 MarR family transcriptional regulator [Staphylococcus argenteus]
MDNIKFEQFNELHLGFIELSKVINEVIEEQNIEISREQMGVFKLLFENKQMTMKEIAERQGVFKTAISKRIKKMEEKGFVKKNKFKR